MTTPLLEIDGVSFGYPGSPALGDVGLALDAGEVVALTGPTGSGKSTLLLLAAGLLEPAAGTVRVAGTDLARVRAADRARMRRTDVGVVLQYGQLLPDLTLLDNVALPLLLGGTAAVVARERAAARLAAAGLADLQDRRGSEVSGGQAQRAAVARALVTGPRLLLADEPTASLDPDGAAHVLDLLLAAVDAGAGLLVVTHDNTVSARAGREVRLRAGAVEHEIALR